MICKAWIFERTIIWPYNTYIRCDDYVLPILRHWYLSKLSTNHGRLECWEMNIEIKRGDLLYLLATDVIYFSPTWSYRYTALVSMSVIHAVLTEYACIAMNKLHRCAKCMHHHRGWVRNWSTGIKRLFAIVMGVRTDEIENTLKCTVGGSI